jgi:hypothetical protein
VNLRSTRHSPRYTLDGVTSVMQVTNALVGRSHRRKWMIRAILTAAIPNIHTRQEARR